MVSHMPIDVKGALRSSRLVFAAQLALLALSVGVAQVAGGSRLGGWSVLALTAVNGLLVGVGSMRARRERPVVQGFMVVLLLMVASLLFWPVWDEYDSVRLR